MSDWDVVEDAGDAGDVVVCTPSVAPAANAPLQQLDVIVLDISRSMKARSTADPDKTREDVSKVAFHTMVDKMVCLELEHAVGLVAFGATVRRTDPTRAYEAFHTELGRLDATENRTRLYDAIGAAADMLVEYRQSHGGEIGERCALRIFALTDGEDNASELRAWQVAQRLQEARIVLDVMPMACANPSLEALAVSTGGLCVAVTSVEQGVALFEREAVVHVASRVADAAAEAPRPIRTADDFDAVVTQLTRVSRVVTTAAATQHVVVASTQRAVSQPSVVQASGTVSGPSSRPLRRVMREFVDMQSSSVAQPFVVEADPMSWKVLLPGPAGTPYEGGFFVVSLVFPATYPFCPMRLRFLTPVYHCNVNADGAVCLDVLREGWSPALTVRRVLERVVELMRSPNPDDPLDSMKASILRQDRATYEAEARRVTAEHATPEGRVRTLYGLE